MTALLPEWVWIVVTGALTVAACGVIGCYLVLRRLSLVGDAISHAVLPGIVLAFLLAGTRTTVPILIGAAAVGLLAAFLIETLRRVGRVQEDASIGIVFTSLFAVGVLMIALAGDRLDIDQDCVLYGEIAYVAWDPVVWAGVDLGPRATLILAGVLAANVLFVRLLWKELLVASFDPGLAASVGVRPGLVHYLLMAMVSVTVVAAFEAVGAILVVAMLVVPGAAAYLLTDRLAPMLLIAAALGLPIALGGYGAAYALEVSISGAMTSVAGLLFALALLLAPRHGVLARLAARASVRLRVALENLLGELHRAAERGQPAPPLPALARAYGWSPALAHLVAWRARRRGLVEQAGGALALRPAGAAEARRVLAAHRGWQDELERLGYDRDHAHASAHRLEHLAPPRGGPPF